MSMPFQPNQTNYTMTNTKKINASTMEVQVKPCKSCPFAGEEPIELPVETQIEINKNLTNSTHLCHSSNNRLICRGGRNLQLKIFYRMGWISEPTDESLQEVFNKYLD
jgi:hypothetical protein